MKRSSLVFLWASWLLLIMMAIFMRQCQCVRVDALKELSKEATSVTIEWSVNDDMKSQPQQQDKPYSSSESDVANDNSTQPVVIEWIGFKIKYFTEKLQYAPVLLKNRHLRKFRIDNLRPNTEYKIQISAINNMNAEGPASNLLSVRTLETGSYALVGLF
jgi:hypothetical protein